MQELMWIMNAAQLRYERMFEMAAGTCRAAAIDGLRYAALACHVSTLPLARTIALLPHRTSVCAERGL
jgi:hypothetical protein